MCVVCECMSQYHFVVKDLDRGSSHVASEGVCKCMNSSLVIAMIAAHMQTNTRTRTHTPAHVQHICYHMCAYMHTCTHTRSRTRTHTHAQPKRGQHLGGGPGHSPTEATLRTEH